MSALSYSEISDPYKRQSGPITTGSSVIGLTFDNGVVIAADELISYGSMARFRNISRVARINDRTILGCGGEYADYQNLMKVIDQMVIDESSHEDNNQIGPHAVHTWITRVQYYNRSKFEPLFCNWIVGGIENNGKPYLGYSNTLGTSFSSPYISSGFGNYFALPLLREECENRNTKLTKDEAIKLVEKCLSVLYYRDCRAHNRYSLAIVTKDEPSVIQESLQLAENWDVANMVLGYE